MLTNWDHEQASDRIEANACRGLWAAVIDGALQDHDWEWFQTSDFRTVARLAGLDPAAALDRLPQIIAARAGERPRRDMAREQQERYARQKAPKLAAE